MSTVGQFLNLCQQHGSDVLYHRSDSTVFCPCRTPEGFRDPIWHLRHPTDPLCNESGMLTDPSVSTEIIVKGFIQPIQPGAVRRMTNEALLEMFGELQADDHVGILPVQWQEAILNFYDWGRSGEDFLQYNSRTFQVVATNLIPDPSDGNPYHHWELGLRLASDSLAA